MRLGEAGFWQHLRQDAPSVLYHYTSLDTMTKIVENEDLFATSIHYLNDSREWSHARSLILNRAKRFLTRRLPESQMVAIRWVIEHLHKPSSQGVYVTSFSEKKDDLSQWRGYTHPGQGVCIGFAVNALKELATEIEGNSASYAPFVFAALGKVIYTAQSEATTFDSILSMAEKYMTILDGEVVKSKLDILIDQSAPFYKDRSFADEAEWRISLVENTHLDVPLPQSFRPGAAMLIPFTKLSFIGRRRDFIKHVVVGPTPHKVLSKRSIEQFLFSKNLPEVPVESSCVPFRSW